jgi:hypothetical protein
MERPKLIGLVALFTMMACGLFSAVHSPRVAASENTSPAPTDPTSVLRITRTDKTDLAINWPAVGSTPAVHGFVSYKALLAMPQVSATVISDENFEAMKVASAHITGVRLSDLTRILHVPPADDMLMARCLDGYVGQYPADYVAAHQPILVLTVDGKTAADWGKSTGNIDTGPYMVSYADFLPAWHLLKHEDKPQVPINVLELEYRSQQEVFGPITPPAHFAPDSPELAGFAIAKQNCLRCHNAGPYGGIKAGWSWETLTLVAKTDPTTFKNYVRDPKSVNAQARMPGNPQYDAETLAALAAYFQSLAKN